MQAWDQGVIHHFLNMINQVRGREDSEMSSHVVALLGNVEDLLNAMSPAVDGARAALIRYSCHQLL